MTKADYAHSGSEDKVMKGYLANGYFQDEDKGVILRRVTSIMETRDEASARTQVYLSKTKLKLQVGI